MSQFTDQEGNVWEATGPDDPNPVFVRAAGSQRGGQVVADPARPREERRDNLDMDNTEGGMVDRRFRQIRDLRGEFIALPAVKEYNVALGTFNAARGVAQTAQGDQSLIVAYARMLDPNSVVREGEFDVTASNEATFNQLRSRIAKEFGIEGGGRLTPEGRREILGEIRNLVVNRFEPAYRNNRLQYEAYAQRNGFDPFEVVGNDVAQSYPSDLLDPIEAPTETRDLAAPDSTEQGGAAIPPEMQQANYEYLQQNWGNIDPQDYVQFRAGLDQQFGYEGDAAAYAEWANIANTMAANGVTPGQLPPLTAPVEQMGGVQSAINDFAQTDLGAGVTSAANAGTMGLAGRMFGQDKVEALRDNHPGASFFGELAGGFTGGYGAGVALSGLGKLAGAGRAANLLSNPITAETAYGGIYGATQDTENPFRGAILGASAGAGGGYAGRRLGEALPGLFAPGAVRRADAAVPTIDQLKDTAGLQYQAAEAAGEVAGADATSELLDTVNGTLSAQGRMTPTGRLIDADSPTSRAHTLINDFAGADMTPTQAGAVRGVLGEGRMTADPAQRRISGMLLDDFDQWADPVLPGISDARETASRYLQGQQIASARRMGDINASQMTQSGQENALRGQFRQLERQTERGTKIFPDNVDNAIQRTAEGTGLSNVARGLGRLAPTSVVSFGGPASIGALVGAATNSPVLGTAALVGTAGLGIASRKLATHMTNRSAEVTELMARGGLSYEQALQQATATAMRRAGGMFGGTSAVGTSQATR